MTRLGEAPPTMPANISDIQNKAQSAADAVAEAIGKLMPLVRDQQLFNAQLKIAKKQAAQSGQYIDPSQLTTGGIGVNLGLDSQTKTMLFAGLGIIALILLLKKAR